MGETKTERARVRIAGIGASAGGIESIERLFDALEDRPGIALVVIQHLSRDHVSLMDEILSRRSGMPVRLARDGERIEPNHVYLLPPGKQMVLCGGCLGLTPRADGPGHAYPIDLFFESLARDAGQDAIAVVLSGTGTDGAHGVQAVKNAGGVVLVESAESARFDGMPASARATGMADAVLDARELGAQLGRLGTQGRAAVPTSVESEPSPTLRAILGLLHEQTGVDFGQYRTSTVGRRVERRSALRGAESAEAYLSELRADAQEVDALYQDLLIGVTSFFRDPEVFAALQAHWLPRLLRQIPAGEEVRVWVAGCATGEEAYSLAMLIEESLEATDRSHPIKIIATDVHDGSLAVASAGIYPASALEHVSSERRARFFESVRAGYRVVSRLRRQVVFARHDVTRETAFTRLHLVSCRNLLIYLRPEAQDLAVSLFHFGLVSGGILLLGKSESPGTLAGELEPLDEPCRIYAKRRDVRLPLPRPISRRPPAPLSPHAPGRVAEPDGRLLATYDRLLDRYMPPALLIDEERRVLDSFAGAERLLRVPARRPSTDVLQLLPPGLAAGVSAALQQLSHEQPRIRLKGVHAVLDDGPHEYTVTAERFAHPAGVSSHVVLTLADEGVRDEARVPPPPEAQSARTWSEERVGTLEAELGHTREVLQATVEELQASNEELITSNEELQSTNEELNSVNEELYSLNSEYQRKISELYESSSEMQHLLEGAQVGVLFLDEHLNIRKFTSRIAPLFNIQTQDLGRNIHDFAANLRRATLVEEIEAALRDGTAREEEVDGPKGTTYFLRIMPYKPILPEHDEAEPGGEPIGGVVLTITDITALGEVRQDLSRLVAIVESSQDAIIGKDLEGQITSWNRGAVRLYGYTQEEILGRHISVLAPPEARGEIEEVLSSVRRGERVEHLETTRLDKSGKLLEVSVSVSPIYDRMGRIVGASAIARDVGALRRIQYELKESEARFRLLLNSTAEAIYGIDLDGTCTFANPACVVMLGYSSTEELIGRNMHDLIHHSTGDGAPYPLEDCRIYRAIREGRGSHVDTEVLWRADGKPFPAEYWSYPILENGDVTGAVVTFFDITERRHAEERMAQEARRREQFIAMLSHELRNPLAAVMNATRLMQRPAGANDPDLDEARDIVERQAQHMARLLDDLLDVNRIARGAIELRLEEVELRQPILQAVEAVSPMYDDRSISLTLELPDEPLTVYGDATRIQQIVLNLLANSARYSPPGSQVVLRTTAETGEVVILVEDRGCGIEPALLPHIFDLFVQGDRELHRAEGGMGVGLTLVKELVELHGGTVSAHSDGSGHGSVFEIRLPLREPRTAPAARATSAGGDAGGGDAGGGDAGVADSAASRTLRIVLVEDQPDPRLALKLLLQRRGHEVIEAADGRAGLEAIEAEAPDLALVDIGLPILDGYEVARAVRAQATLDRVRLVALTGYGSEEDARVAKEAGFDDHVTKPAKPEDLDRLLAARGRD